jgi:glycosyltransferase involved in cell wall biosynthesis
VTQSSPFPTGGPAQAAGRIAVLIPCFNEQATIAKVVRDFRAALPEAAVYVYDNNSTDDSRREAEWAGAILGQERAQGKGHVVRTMFREVEADLYVLVDGDDTYSAKDVGHLIAPILEGRADMVLGARLSQFRGDSFRPLHFFGNWLFTTLFNLLFGARLSDTLSGYRALTRAAARAIRLDSGGFDVETEINIRAVEAGFRIVEVPLPYGSRPEGSQSKLHTFRDGFRVLRRMLSASPRGRRRAAIAGAFLLAVVLLLVGLML